MNSKDYEYIVEIARYGNISKAARLSDMHRKSVEYIVRKLNLKSNPSKDDDFDDDD